MAEGQRTAFQINATGNDRPALKDLYDHVVMEVAERWKDLGVQLLRSDQEGILNIIEANHPHDVVSCCKHVFKKWLDTSEDATWNMLMKALRRPSVQLNYLAGQLKKMLIIKYTQPTTRRRKGSSMLMGSIAKKRKVKFKKPTVKKRKPKTQKRKVKSYMKLIYPLDVTQPTAKKRKLKNVIQHTAKKRKVEVGVLDEVQNKLKTAYKRICNSDNPHCYIQLALVRDEICNIHDKRLNKITRHTLQGQVDEILKIKEPLKRGLEDIFHYNDSPCPRLILILGAPGIGKSTLANEICLKWATDKDSFLSHDYDLIILIQLRAILERTLQQAMIEAVGSEAAYDELLTKSYGERCLIILEGLDEISTQWQQNDTMFCQLVKNTVFLSYANILVTSRPHACIDLHKDIKNYARTIEIVGFDKPQIKERAKLYFQSSDTAEKFMEQVNSDSHISSLCYVPLCLNMVLDHFKRNNEVLHTTLTKLYQSFIISKIDDHIRFKKAVSLGTVLEGDEKYFKNVSTLLSGVPNVLCKEAMETVFLLSKLAYKSNFEWYEQKIGSVKNPKIIYTNTDLTQCNIMNLENDACGLLKATNTLYATSNTAVYTFNHLSVQEYFCALYISLLPEDQQLQLLKDHISDYPHMWPFFAGITKLRSSDVIDYLYQFLLQDEKLENAGFIDCNKFRASNDHIIVVLNSIYEAQLSQCVCHKYKKVSLTIPMSVDPYDCMSISYFMSIAPVVHLSLHFCFIGDQKAQMLARCKNLIPSLKLLDLSYNYITHKGMESVITIIKSNISLTHFSIARNPIGDDGVKVFSLLKLIHLIQLNISRIGLTKVGARALGEYLKVNSCLQSLEISYNRIKDNGLTKVLENMPSTLVRLIVSNCHLTYNGAVSIGKILRNNKSLKYLKVSSNSIGDDGISAISDCLHVNTTLIQLIARGCRFHGKGAESIAKMLQANKTLKYLDISSNNIGDDGIRAITLSIQANTTLIQLKIFNCGGAEGIANMLIVNKILKELGITYTDDDDSIVLETFCESNCELRQLNIAVDEADDSFYTIINYVDTVNLDAIDANNATHYITYDDLYYSYAQKRCILRVWL